MKRFISLLLCLLMFITVIPIGQAEVYAEGTGDEATYTSMPENDDNFNPDDWIDDSLYHRNGISLMAQTKGTQRYTVLALDVSGSMGSTEMSKMKEASIEYCKTVLQSRGTNYVGIVKFASSASIACGFSDDLTALTNTINSLYSGGGTDTAGGLNKAKYMYDQLAVSNIIERNIILFSDGEPNSASSAQSVANSMFSSCNIYTIGYNLYSSGASFMQSIQNCGYYNVLNSDDISQAVANIASQILAGSSGNINNLLTNETTVTVYGNKKSPAAMVNRFNVLEGATVTVDGNDYKTDANGNVKIPTVTSGTVSVSKKGYVTKEIQSAALSINSKVYLEKDEGKEPIINSVITEKIDLLYDDYEMDLLSSDAITLTADVVWKTAERKNLYLTQSSNRIEFDQAGKLSLVLKDYFDISQDIYIVAVDVQGNTTKKKLNFACREGLFEGFKMSLGEDLSFNVPDSAGFLAGAEIGVGISSSILETLPIEVAIDDGKFYVSIGVDIATYTHSDKYATSSATKNRAHVLETETKNCVSRVKDMFKEKDKLLDASDISKGVKKLKNFKQTYGNAIKYPQGSFGVEADFTLIGFGEGYVDSDGKCHWLDGGIILCPSASVSWGGQFAIGPFPAYWEASIGAQIEAKLNLLVNEAAKSFTANGDISGALSASVGAGAGIKKVLSVGGGITGTLSPIYKIYLDKQNYFRLDAKLNGYFKLTVIGFEYKYDAKKYKLDGTWIEYPDSKSTLMSIDNMDIADWNNYEIVDRGYIQNPSYFTANNIKLFDDSYNHNTIKTNVYTYSAPQIVGFEDGSELIIWLDDVNSRTDINRTAVYYTYCKNGVYTQPQMISDDGTADFYPDLALINNTAYVVWNNEKSVMDDSSDMTAMLGGLEVSAARFDAEAGSFTDISTLTDNDIMDISPSLFGDDSGVYCTWNSNTSNTIDEPSGYSIYISKSEENSWSAPTEYASELNSIESMAGMVIDGKPEIIYCVDTDGDITTIDDIRMEKNMPWVKFQEDKMATNVSVCDNSVYWFSDGGIYTYDYPTGVTEKISSDNEAVNDHFKVFAASGNKYIVFEEYSGVYSELYGYKCGADGKWSNKVKFTDTNNSIFGFDGYVNSAGEMEFLINEAEVLNEGEEIYGESNLVRLFEDAQIDLDIQSIYYNNEYAVECNDLDVMVDVKNIGTIAATGTIEILNSLDESLTSEPIALNAGASDTMVLSLQLREDFRGESLRVVINCDDYICETTLEITYEDIAVENISYSVNESGNAVISADIVNRGYGDGNVTAKLRSASEEGSVIDQKSVNVTELLDIENVSFEVPNNDGDIYYVTIDSDDESSTNNSDFVVIENKNYVIENGKAKILFAENALDENIVIPATINGYDVESIGASAYDGCVNVKSLSVPQNVKFIGDMAFANCSSLKEINISKSVEQIGMDVFKNCPELIQINVDSENPYFVSRDGVLYEKNADNTLTLVAYPCGKSEPVIINSYVTSIKQNAFNGATKLTEITINSEYIGEGSFKNCTALESINFGSNLKEIGEFAFSGCTSLKNISLPASVTSIGDNAFSGCVSLTKASVEKGISFIGAGIFSGCDKLSVLKFAYSENMSSSNYRLTYLFGNTIVNSTVKELNIIADRLPSNALEGFNAVEKLEISADYIDSYACANLSKLLNVSINARVLNNNVFSGCSELVKLNIKDGVEQIGNKAFGGCVKLTTLSIPDSCTSIGSEAFYGCTRLKDIALPRSISALKSYLFSDCTSLENITLPDGIESIESYVFSNCTSLEEINIPDSVNQISNYAFQNCSGLSELELPQNLSYIGTGAFSGLSQITNVTIPYGVESLTNSVFANCDRLNIVRIPSSVHSISSNAFDGCNSLKNVYFGGNAQEWNAVCPTPETVNNAQVYFVGNSEVDTVRFEYTQGVFDNSTLDDYSSFKEIFEKRYVVPALHQGFIPDSEAYWKKRNALLIGGHFEDGKSSAILMLDMQSGNYIGEYSLYDSEGEIVDEIHGMAQCGDYIYLTHGNRIGVVPVSAFSASKTNVAVLKYIETPFESESKVFITLRGTNILIGGKYNDETLLVEYSVHPLTGKIVESVPIKAYSFDDVDITDVAYINNNIIVSKSTNISNDSIIERYVDAIPTLTGETVSVNGKNVGIYKINKTADFVNSEIPPMLVDVCPVAGELYLLFASSPKKYSLLYSGHSTENIWSALPDNIISTELDPELTPDAERYISYISAAMLANHSLADIVSEEELPVRVSDLVSMEGFQGDRDILGSTESTFYIKTLGNMSLTEYRKYEDAGIAVMLLRNDTEDFVVFDSIRDTQGNVSDDLRAMEYAKEFYNSVSHKYEFQDLTFIGDGFCGNIAEYMGVLYDYMAISFNNNDNSGYITALKEKMNTGYGKVYSYAYCIERCVTNFDSVQNNGILYYIFETNNVPEFESKIESMIMPDGDSFITYYSGYRGNGKYSVDNILFGNGVSRIFSNPNDDIILLDKSQIYSALNTNADEKIYIYKDTATVLGGLGDNSYYLESGSNVNIFDAGGNDIIYVKAKDINDALLCNVDSNTMEITLDNTYIRINSNRNGSVTLNNGIQELSIVQSEEQEYAYSLEFSGDDYIIDIYDEQGEIIDSIDIDTIYSFRDNIYSGDFYTATVLDKGQIMLSFSKAPHRVEIHQNMISEDNYVIEDILLDTTSSVNMGDYEASFAYCFVPDETGYYSFVTNTLEVSLGIYDEKFDEVLSSSTLYSSSYAYLEKDKKYYIIPENTNKLDLTVKKGIVQFSEATDITEGESVINISSGQFKVLAFTPSETGVYNIDADAMLEVYQNDGYIKKYYDIIYSNDGDGYDWIFEKGKVYYIICMPEYYNPAGGDREVTVGINRASNYISTGETVSAADSGDYYILEVDENILYNIEVPSYDVDSYNGIVIKNVQGETIVDTGIIELGYLCASDKYPFVIFSCPSMCEFSVNEVGLTDLNNIPIVDEGEKITVSPSSQSTLVGFTPSADGVYSIDAGEHNMEVLMFDEHGSYIGWFYSDYLYANKRYYFMITTHNAEDIPEESLTLLIVNENTPIYQNGEESVTITLEENENWADFVYVAQEDGLFSFNVDDASDAFGVNAFHSELNGGKLDSIDGYINCKAGDIVFAEVYYGTPEPINTATDINVKIDTVTPREAVIGINDIGYRELMCFKPSATGEYFIDSMVDVFDSNMQYCSNSNSNVNMNAGNTYYIYNPNKYSDHDVIQFIIYQLGQPVNLNCEELELDVPKNVIIDNSVESFGELMYKFTVPENGRYHISFDNGRDICMYDEYMQFINGWDRADVNNRCEIDFTAIENKTYYVSVFCYEDDANSNICLSKSGNACGFKMIDSANTYDIECDINSNAVEIDALGNCAYVDGDGDVSKTAHSKVQQIEIACDTNSLKVGEYIPVSVQVLPADTQSSNVIWKSSNNNVAKVIVRDDNAYVYAMDEGSADITAYIKGEEIVGVKSFNVSYSEDIVFTISGDGKENIYKGPVTISVDPSEYYDLIYINGVETKEKTYTEDGQYSVCISGKNSATGEISKKQYLSFEINTKKPRIFGVYNDAAYYLEKYVYIDAPADSSILIDGKEAPANKTICINGVGTHSVVVNSSGETSEVSFRIEEMPSISSITVEQYVRICSELEEIEKNLSANRVRIIKDQIELYENTIKAQMPWQLSEIYAENDFCYISVKNNLGDYSDLPIMKVKKFDSRKNLISETRQYISDELVDYIISDNRKGVCAIEVSLVDDSDNALCSSSKIEFPQYEEGNVVKMIDGNDVIGIIPISEFENYTPSKENYLFIGWYNDAAYEKEIIIDDEFALNNRVVYARFVPENQPISVTVDERICVDGTLELKYDYMAYDCFVCVAVYDGETLVDLKRDTLTKNVKYKEFVFDIESSDETDYTYKIFHWADGQSMKPLMAPYEGETTREIHVGEILQNGTHPYENNVVDEKEYVYPHECDHIDITFSKETETENNCDYIYIYDMNNQLYGKYCGTSLAGVTLSIPGNTVRIKLTTDGSVQKYGYLVEDIVVYR